MKFFLNVHFEDLSATRRCGRSTRRRRTAAIASRTAPLPACPPASCFLLAAACLLLAEHADSTLRIRSGFSTTYMYVVMYLSEHVLSGQNLDLPVISGLLETVSQYCSFFRLSRDFR